MSQAISSHAKRIHVVLIPGFAGFDALEQLESYGSLTELRSTALPTKSPGLLQRVRIPLTIANMAAQRAEATFVA